MMLNFLPAQPLLSATEAPGVWVRRLATYTTRHDKPEPFRNIPLTKGLNIVVAEEPHGAAKEAQATGQTDAAIAGHSAGKTTFCRLLRYVLGEPTFGTKVGMEHIGKAFPDGYVGAEIFIRGTLWSVLRPLGENKRASYAKEGVTLEALLADVGPPVSSASYTTHLGLENEIENLVSASPARSERTYRWGHLLAWWARDQQARFQTIHGWRESRSDSEWPGLNAPKTDALFLMRLALGLFHGDELLAEEELAKLERAKLAGEKRVEDARREPEFGVRMYAEEARHLLTQQAPDDASEIENLPVATETLAPSLQTRAEAAIGDLQTSIEQLRKDEAVAQKEVDELSGAIEWHRGELKQNLATALLAENKMGESTHDQQQAAELQKDYQEKKDALCKHGDVLFSQCDHFLARINKLKFSDAQDKRAREETMTRQTAFRQDMATKKIAIEQKIQELDTSRKTKSVARAALAERARTAEMQRDLIRTAAQNLHKWHEYATQPAGYAAISDGKAKIKSYEDQIWKTKQTLSTLLAKHQEAKNQLQAIFSGVTKFVLPSGAYDGRVGLDNRELSFQITHGAAMSGEAVETLSVLLADITCLLHGTAFPSAARIPGFLIHDSPREADLDLNLYYRFIRLAAAIQAHFGGRDNCPFQYILTTTTPPPDACASDDFVCLRLDASKPEEMLLRRDVAMAVGTSSDGALLF